MTAALSSGTHPAPCRCGFPMPKIRWPCPSTRARSLRCPRFAPRMVRAVDSVNRYPELLPERFRRLITKHLGFEEEQFIVGAGATGVVMQVLQGLTRPGDRIVMAAPTFDGYPIFAQMARLQTVTVPLDEQGHHDLDAMADPPPTHKSWRCAGRTTPPARWRRPTTSSLPSAHWLGHHGAARRGIHRVRVATTSHPPRVPVATVPERRCRAHLLKGVRVGGHTDRVRHLLAGHGSGTVVDAVAVRGDRRQPGRGRGVVRGRSSVASPDRTAHRRTRPSSLTAVGDGCLER